MNIKRLIYVKNYKSIEYIKFKTKEEHFYVKCNSSYMGL